jgi:hypothetical protein
MHFFFMLLNLQNSNFTAEADEKTAAVTAANIASAVDHLTINQTHTTALRREKRSSLIHQSLLYTEAVHSFHETIQRTLKAETQPMQI